MKRSSGPRKTADLSESFIANSMLMHSRLPRRSGFVGLGPAVRSQDHLHQDLPRYRYQALPLDLNHDGTVDFY